MHTTDVYPVANREDAIVDIPIPFARAGTWHAEIRARVLDAATGDWYFEVGYNTGIAENRIGTFPAEWVRRPDITDLDGIVPDDVLARMRGDADVIDMPQRDASPSSGLVFLGVRPPLAGYVLQYLLQETGGLVPSRSGCG